MRDAANDLILSGQAVLPLLLWLGTGSVNVFAVASLFMSTLMLLALTAGAPIPAPIPPASNIAPKKRGH